MLPDLSSISTFGGAMRDYSDAIDATTDEAAKYRNRYVTDVAMMGRTAPLAVVSFQPVNNAAPADPSSGFIHESLWGNTPAVKPSVARASEGVHDITYPATVVDPLSAEEVSQGVAAGLLGGSLTSHTLNFRRAYAQVQCSDGTLRHVAAEVTGANVVRVRGWTAAGALDDLPGQIITVWIW